jgi:hypothetical protein
VENHCHFQRNNAVHVACELRYEDALGNRYSAPIYGGMSEERQTVGETSAPTNEGENLDDSDVIQEHAVQSRPLAFYRLPSLSTMTCI